MKKILEIFINIIVDSLILWPFYYLLKFSMKEVVGFNKNKDKGITLLALNSIRFRGDLEVLANSGFRVLLLSYKWQTRIFYAYSKKDRSQPKFFLNPSVNSTLYKDRIRIRKYLSLLLPRLIKNKRIDCFIGAGLFYNQDFDWGAAAKTVGCPYIVFHRENLIGSKNRHMYIVKKAKFLKDFGFVGTSIVFHNKEMKKIFDKYSGVDSKKIFALGALRMDKFVEDTESEKNSVNNKRIMLFSFPASNVISSNYYSEDFGWHELHDKVHESIVELAAKYPEIEFIIKHKGVGWESTKSLLERMNAFDLINLKIFGDSYNAQKLILKSDVVTGFCSTAMLEAGIAGKPVVYPLFAEANKERYEDFVCFDNARNLFDIAYSKEKYKELIMERIKNPRISELSRKYRRLEFENQVSSLKSNSLERYTNLITDICNNK